MASLPRLRCQVAQKIFVIIDSRPGLRSFGSAQHAQGVVALDAQADPGVGDALSDDRVLGLAVLHGDVDDLLQLVLEGHLLAQGRGAALEDQGSHGDLPAAVHVADDVLGGGARVVEEDLAELRIAGHLDDGADLDALLIHRNEDVGDARGASAGRPDRCGRRRSTSRTRRRRRSRPSDR